MPNIIIVLVFSIPFVFLHIKYNKIHGSELLNCVSISIRTDFMAKNPLFRVSRKVAKGHFKMPRVAVTKMSEIT